MHFHDPRCPNLPVVECSVFAIVSSVSVDEEVEPPDEPEGEHVEDHEEDVDTAEEA